MSIGKTCRPVPLPTAPLPTARGGHALPRVITIDGPASAGKTSVAEALAARIGYHVYDTGALYRAATLLAVRAGITDVTPNREAEIVERIRATTIVVSAPKETGSEPTVTIDGEDVTAALRGPVVNGLVSPVSQLPGVRAALMDVQRAAAAVGGVIMVGRDMGTVVVPDAPLKLYLTADPHVRAARRTRQLTERGLSRPYDDVLREEMTRDRIDSGRSVAPLRPAPDAVTITTDDLTIPQIVEQAIAAVDGAVSRVEGGPAEGAKGAVKPAPFPSDVPGKAVPVANPMKADKAAKPAPRPLNRFERFHGTRSYRLIFRFTCGLIRLIVLRYARVSVRGAHHMPKRGPVIVASNHLHNADPTVIAFALPRNIQYMAKRELWRSRFFGALIEFYGAFPIERGTADRAALRYAEGLLKRGRVLGMFPEGTRSSKGQIEQVLPGAAFVAMRTGAPILPVAVTGTQILPLDAKSAAHAGKRHGRGRVTVTVGAPFHLTPGANGKLDAATATDEIMRHIAAMLPPEYRGIYGAANDPPHSEQATGSRAGEE